MQEDDELLHPACPDEESHKTDDAQSPEGGICACSGTDQATAVDVTDEVEEASEALGRPSEDGSGDESEESFDLQELSCALQDDEGQITAAGDGANADSSVIDFSADKKKIEKPTKIEDQAGQEDNPADRAYEDECPDLVELSTLNKEFRPFRYRFLLIA